MFNMLTLNIHHAQNRLPKDLPGKPSSIARVELTSSQQSNHWR